MEETTNETALQKTEPVRKRLSLLRDQRGAGFSEYLVLVAIIVIAGIAIWNAFQNSVENKVTNTREQLEGMQPDQE
jgi:Flp pilus assembly pilin Flp